MLSSGPQDSLDSLDGVPPGHSRLHLQLDTLDLARLYSVSAVQALSWLLLHPAHLDHVPQTVPVNVQLVSRSCLGHKGMLADLDERRIRHDHTLTSARPMLSLGVLVRA